MFKKLRHFFRSQNATAKPTPPKATRRRWGSLYPPLNSIAEVVSDSGYSSGWELTFYDETYEEGLVQIQLWAATMFSRTGEDCWANLENAAFYLLLGAEASSSDDLDRMKHMKHIANSYIDGFWGTWSRRR